MVRALPLRPHCEAVLVGEAERNPHALQQAAYGTRQEQEGGVLTAFQFRDHPLRSRLSSEMHGRKLPPIQAPARLMQVILSSDDERVDEERQALKALLTNATGLAADARYFQGEAGGIHLIWERHTEFSSYTLIRPGPFADPFDPGCFDRLDPAWFHRLPGEVVRATQMAVSRVERPDVIEKAFLHEDLVHCDLLEGLASLSSDFRLNTDGFGRLLIVDHGMTPAEVSVVVQRVQELGNYRNLALLALPVAQELSRTVTRLEQRLAETTSEIADDAVSDERLLRVLSDLAAETAGIVARTDYRMSATRAYAEMVEDRLASLRVTRVPGHQTLGDFTERRLLPAVRTCMSFSSRLEVLSQRLSWTSSLLRTRVDTALSVQNRDLLQSMNRRTALQLHLQQTVEGLSVVAISYYAVGLLEHVLAAVHMGSHWDQIHLLAALVPVILATAWFSMRRFQRRMETRAGAVSTLSAQSWPQESGAVSHDARKHPHPRRNPAP